MLSDLWVTRIKFFLQLKNENSSSCCAINAIECSLLMHLLLDYADSFYHRLITILELSGEERYRIYYTTHSIKSIMFISVTWIWFISLIRVSVSYSPVLLHALNNSIAVPVLIRITLNSITKRIGPNEFSNSVTLLWMNGNLWWQRVNVQMFP